MKTCVFSSVFVRLQETAIFCSSSSSSILSEARVFGSSRCLSARETSFSFPQSMDDGRHSLNTIREWKKEEKENDDRHREGGGRMRRKGGGDIGKDLKVCRNVKEKECQQSPIARKAQKEEDPNRDGRLKDAQKEEDQIRDGRLKDAREEGELPNALPRNPWREKSAVSLFHLLRFFSKFFSPVFENSYFNHSPPRIRDILSFFIRRIAAETQHYRAERKKRKKDAKERRNKRKEETENSNVHSPLLSPLSPLSSSSFYSSSVSSSSSPPPTSSSFLLNALQLNAFYRAHVEAGKSTFYSKESYTSSPPSSSSSSSSFSSSSFSSVSASAVSSSPSSVLSSLSHLPPVWPSSIPFCQPPPPPRRVWENALLTFIGHNSFLLQVAGCNILIDPVFSHSVGIFGTIGVRRTREPGISLETLPPIDLVLLTDDHFDHLEKQSLQYLQTQHCSTFVAGLGMNKHLPRVHGYHNMYLLGWFDEMRFGDLRIIFLPSFHWSGLRGVCATPRPPRVPFPPPLPIFPFDFNTTLWGSFLILKRSRQQPHTHLPAFSPYSSSTSSSPSSPSSPSSSSSFWSSSCSSSSQYSGFFLGGDSAYAPIFEDIKSFCQDQNVKIQLSVLPIGTFKPRNLMKSVNMAPEEAVQAHLDLESSTSVGCQFDTFHLGEEAFGEAAVRLKNVISKHQLAEDAFILLEPGEQFVIETDA